VWDHPQDRRQGRSAVNGKPAIGCRLEPSASETTTSSSELVTARMGSTKGKISAKRLLPVAQKAGYSGSARSFRRLVAMARDDYRRRQHYGRRAGNAVDLETAKGGTVSLAPDLMALLSLVASVVLLFRYVKLSVDWRRRLFILYTEID
jgi:hypothetical protein